MDQVNPDQIKLELKKTFEESGYGKYYVPCLDVFKEKPEVLDSIREAANKLRELGFEAGIVLDLDESYHKCFIIHSSRGIYLSDSGDSSEFRSENRVEMAKTADMFSLEEEELLAHFVDLPKAREKVFCNIMNEKTLILFPGFKVSRFKTSHETFQEAFQKVMGKKK